MPEFSYSSECFPGGDSPIIVADENGELVPVRAGFGLLPHWADVKLARRTYNARSETVSKLPSFKNAWAKKQVCLVPVENFVEPFYESGKAEWMAIGRKDGELTMLAGLWELPEFGPNKGRRTFTMLTVSGAGHPIMSRMHGLEDEKRSVVPIPQPSWPTWLRPADHEAMLNLLVQFPAEDYTFWPKPMAPRKPKVTAPASSDDLLSG